jgi:hypothetical protein
MFVSTLFLGGRSLGFLVIDFTMLALLLVLRYFQSSSAPANPDRATRTLPYRQITILILTVSVALFVITALERGLAFPHGGWDAWMIWNFRARWIFRAAEWTTAFTSLLANTDYPLLLPSTVVQGWNLLGHESTLIPILIGISFELAAVALLISGLWVLASPAKAIMSGLILMATPFLVTLGAYQYADVPVAYYYLASLVFIGLYDCAFPDRHEWLVLAGFLAAIACWTKNDGIVFLGGLVGARAVTALTGRKALLRDLAWLAIGMLPPGLLVLYFKHTFAPPNVLFGGQTIQGFVPQIFDRSRHALILPAFFRESLRFGLWKISPLPLLLIYAFIAGIRVQPKHRRYVATCAIVMLLMIVGYYFVYLTEGVPNIQLQQHLDSSLDRLLFQLWPIFLLMYFLCVHGPLQEFGVAAKQNETPPA